MRHFWLLLLSNQLDFKIQPIASLILHLPSHFCKKTLLKQTISQGVKPSGRKGKYNNSEPWKLSSRAEYLLRPESYSGCLLGQLYVLDTVFWIFYVGCGWIYYSYRLKDILYKFWESVSPNINISNFLEASMSSLHYVKDYMGVGDPSKWLLFLSFYSYCPAW